MYFRWEKEVCGLTVQYTHINTLADTLRNGHTQIQKLTNGRGWKVLVNGLAKGVKSGGPGGV